MPSKLPSRVPNGMQDLDPQALRVQHADSFSVIFSFWTGMLDLVGVALQLKGFVFQRIDGTHTEVRRRSSLEDFRNNACCTVFLASIGSAGVG